mmetsp:Transcript_18910/g.44126  ORF Transcript_18910/g.44126 Transcript_18910/m.44126 type:complete len:220 (+) Transcript_18910:559-1218(+)
MLGLRTLVSQTLTRKCLLPPLFSPRGPVHASSQLAACSPTVELTRASTCSLPCSARRSSKPSRRRLSAWALSRPGLTVRARSCLSRSLWFAMRACTRRLGQRRLTGCLRRCSCAPHAPASLSAGRPSSRGCGHWSCRARACARANSRRPPTTRSSRRRSLARRLRSRSPARCSARCARWSATLRSRSCASHSSASSRCARWGRERFGRDGSPSAFYEII